MRRFFLALLFLLLSATAPLAGNVTFEWDPTPATAEERAANYYSYRFFWGPVSRTAAGWTEYPNAVSQTLTRSTVTDWPEDVDLCATVQAFVKPTGSTEPAAASAYAAELCIPAGAWTYPPEGGEPIPGPVVVTVPQDPSISLRATLTRADAATVGITRVDLFQQAPGQTRVVMTLEDGSQTEVVLPLVPVP